MGKESSKFPNVSHGDLVVFLTGNELDGSCPRGEETSVFPPHWSQAHLADSKAKAKKLCLYILKKGLANGKLHSSVIQEKVSPTT